MSTATPRKPDSPSYMRGWLRVQYKNDATKVDYALTALFGNTKRRTEK